MYDFVQAKQMLNQLSQNQIVNLQLLFYISNMRISFYFFNKLRNPFVFERFICSDEPYQLPRVSETNSNSLISFFETSRVFLSEEALDRAVTTIFSVFSKFVFFFRTLKSFYVFFAFL